MTKKELEAKLKDVEAALEEAAGLNEIYKGGITKSELKAFGAKWFIIGGVVGGIVVWLLAL